MCAARVAIKLAGDARVSGLWQSPARPRSALVLAHGAGAGMGHPFMAAVADGLERRGVATLRYQFPYMERGSRRPDPPAIAQAAVRAAVGEAARRAPKLPLFAGGKSFGGRMTSQAQAHSALSDVQGLVFLGFPLHPPGKPSARRGEHLLKVGVPMLFLQGARDAFATPAHLLPLLKRLGQKAQHHPFDDADHSFHVPKRSGRTDVEVMDELLDAAADWMASVTA